MTPQILLHSLQHCFIRMEHIVLLIFDECHHAQAQSRHPYAQIMKEFYKTNTTKVPRIFGMTASPIVGKGGPNQLEYSRRINSLENLLEGKICSVDDNLELESVAATPDIKIYLYGPVANHTSGFIVTCILKLEETKDECVRTIRKELCDDFQELQKKIKNLERIHGNLIFCLENIGLQGASYVAKILVSSDCNDLMQMELDNNDKVGCIADHYLKKAHSILNVELLHDDTESDSTSLMALVEPFFSNKLIVLIGMLSTYRLKSNVKCIIFVERVFVARSLAYIIGNLKSLDFWKCAFLVGCRSGLRSMSRKKMNAIVQEFSLGKLNLLIATNVAEEGLDIQTCCLVVRFDLPQTVSSFIQSRARARMRTSEYVFLLERGNERDEMLLESFSTREDIMNKEIISRTSNESFNDLEEKIYKVYSTGASVSTGCSISLLHHYCAKLPRDMYFTPQPKFFYLENLDGTTCRVILPPNAPFRQVVSSPCSSKDEAKRVASLQACIALHERGAFSDYLLPDHGKGTRKANGSECEDNEDDYLREELHEMLVPAALKEPWSDSEAHVLLHFYEIKFIPIPEDRLYWKFGLVLKRPLPKEAEVMKLDLHLAHGRIVKTSFIFSRILTFSGEEITLAQKFQEMFLKVILDRSEFFSDVVLLGSNLKSHCSLTFYLLLPVKQCADGKSVVVDWHTIRCCLSSPAFGCHVNSDRMDYVPICDTLELLNGPVKKVDVLHSLIFTPHNKQFFFIDGRVDDINANSLRKGSKDISYAQHYKERFGIQLKHPDQPFLKAKQLFALRNLLHNRLQESTVVRETEEHFDVIPPELCCLKIVGFSKDIGSSLSLLPSLMHRLENLLVAIELKNVLSRSFQEASEISGDCILKALTTEKCLERFSLERFEVLGDAFLKYAVGRHSFLSFEGLDEGQLTKKRSSIVNNANLYDLAIKNNLQVYICDESFEPSQFFALGRPCMVSCSIDTKSSTCYQRGMDIDADVAETHKSKCSKSHRWLHRKTIADVVEALVGAFLVESGFRAATAFLRWLGIQVDFEILNVHRVIRESKVNLSLFGKIDVPALEESLGYKFRHKGLLLQAFVHPSYQKHSGGCYQNLEFLGDAVMEYLVTSYLYSVYPDLKPGQLTDLRSITVNNNSLALIAAQQFFHLYLLKDSSGLTQAINEFVSYAHLSESEQVLGDIVESSIGAILLDSGFNLELVWKIMLKLLNPILSFSSLKLNPVRELRELCQCKNFELQFPDHEKVRGDYLVRIEIRANGELLSFTATNHSSKVARRMAAQEALRVLKARGYRHKSKSLEEIVQSTHKREAQLIGYDEECMVIDDSDILEAENLVLSNSTETPSGLDWQEEQVVPPSRDNSHHEQPNLSMWSSGESSAHTDKLQNNSHDPVLQRQIQQNIEISNDYMETIGQKSAKSKLYEICAAHYWNRPEFVCCKEEGPSHLRMFTSMVSVKADGVKSVLLECESDPKPQKKAAEEHAAQGALWCLNRLGYLPKQ
ncbi:hypothetical protein DsansV1_C34g0226111 [Dioscorea sansibarensis]